MANKIQIDTFLAKSFIFANCKILEYFTFYFKFSAQHNPQMYSQLKDPAIIIITEDQCQLSTSKIRSEDKHVTVNEARSC